MATCTHNPPPQIIFQFRATNARYSPLSPLVVCACARHRQAGGQGGHHQPQERGGGRRGHRVRDWVGLGCMGGWCDVGRAERRVFHPERGEGRGKGRGEIGRALRPPLFSFPSPPPPPFSLSLALPSLPARGPTSFFPHVTQKTRKTQIAPIPRPPLCLFPVPTTGAPTSSSSLALCSPARCFTRPHNKKGHEGQKRPRRSKLSPLS